MSNKKAWYQVLDEAERQGLKVTSTGSTHFRITRPLPEPGWVPPKPKGKPTGRGSQCTPTQAELEAWASNVVIAAQTPSDYRTMANSIAYMRRLLGFRWQGH